jgi:hypothetical protein
MALITSWLGAAPTAAQELADFDYENLSFRGFGLEVGHLWGSRIEEANTIGLRFDLGYLGPGVRIVPHFTYWSSELKRVEVAELESSVARLIEAQTEEPAPNVNLGTVDWSDRVLGLDAQAVWAVPGNLLTFAGLGAAVHFLNGDGPAISGTFVEDLLDTAKAGFNFHVGLEVPWERFRLYSVGRFDVLEDLHYFEVRVGGQIMTGPSAPGER